MPLGLVAYTILVCLVQKLTVWRTTMGPPPRRPVDRDRFAMLVGEVRLTRRRRLRQHRIGMAAGSAITPWRHIKVLVLPLGLPDLLHVGAPLQQGVI